MRRKFEWEWEMIENLSQEGVFQSSTYRAKVIGGWLIRTVLRDFKLKGISESTTMIQDRDHEWMIVPKIEEVAVQAPKIKASDFEAPKA